MTQWPSTRARRVYRALLRIGWVPLSQTGSHVKLRHRESKYPDYIWAFHEKEENRPSHASPHCQAYGASAIRPVGLAPAKVSAPPLALRILPQPCGESSLVERARCQSHEGLRGVCFAGREVEDVEFQE